MVDVCRGGGGKCGGGGGGSGGGGGGGKQSCQSDKPLNHRETPPVGASSGVSVAHLSCKSVSCIIDRKNREIGDEQILDVSSNFRE